MQTATSNGITIINFGMGSAMAATVMDLLSVVMPKAVLFLGKCGGLKKNNEVAICCCPLQPSEEKEQATITCRRKCPPCPSFRLQMAVSHVIRRYEQDYFTGTVYTTNRRVWSMTRI